MEEIEVVIKVSERKYKGLQREDDKSLSYYEKVIANGTPLPKGHGRLIDADALVDTLGASDRDIYCELVIKEDAQTIIEADKGDGGNDG